MKNNLILSPSGVGSFMAILLVFLFIGKTINAQITIHTIGLKNTSELIGFFRHSAASPPLISAHRGGSRVGFPENCLATFENTLQYMPAIFEIDPRLTKDSVAVLMHDATLDRTTTGKGKLADYTWEELKKIRLKDKEGNVTPYPISTLDEVLEWGKGKTIFVLDDKDLPYKMVAELLRKHNAFANTLMTTRNAKIAKQFYQLDNRFVFEAYVFDMEDVAEYEAEGIPWSHVMAYIGPKDIPENAPLCRELNKRGVKAMISGAPSIDKEFLAGKTTAYNDAFSHGIEIFESDQPVQAAIQTSGLQSQGKKKLKFYGKKEIPLNEIKFQPTPVAGEKEINLKK